MKTWWKKQFCFLESYLTEKPENWAWLFRETSEFLTKSTIHMCVFFSFQLGLWHERCPLGGPPHRAGAPRPARPHTHRLPAHQLRAHGLRPSVLHIPGTMWWEALRFGIEKAYSRRPSPLPAEFREELLFGDTLIRHFKVINQASPGPPLSPQNLGMKRFFFRTENRIFHITYSMVSSATYSFSRISSSFCSEHWPSLPRRPPEGRPQAVPRRPLHLREGGGGGHGKEDTGVYMGKGVCFYLRRSRQVIERWELLLLGEDYFEVMTFEVMNKGQGQLWFFTFSLHLPL